MRALILAAILLASTIAVAQPTTTKPDEHAPTGTATVPTIKVTTKRFGSIKFGKKLTLAALKKVFAKATFKAVKGTTPGWIITRGEDLLAHADATRITISRGPIEAHGVMIDDDGAELAGGNFTGAFCFVEPDLTEAVTCNKDALSITLVSCAAKPQGDSVPVTGLAGCKVQEIAWIAYAAKTQ